MEAGRELDKLVGEKVFGFNVVERKSPTNRVEFFYELGKALVLLPGYSTHIASAWEVVEKLKTSGGDIQIFQYQNGARVIVYKAHSYDPLATAVADTAPHAICLAVLEAISHHKD